MTWLSRLLTQNSLHHSARALGRHTRQDKGLRRQMTLEQLEGRVVLSNVGVTYNPTTLALAIVGDAGNDGIRINENAQDAVTNPGGVSVAGIVVGLNSQTLVNSFNQVYTTPGPVSSISVSFGAGTSSNVEKIVLFGAGKTTPTNVESVTITVGAQALGLSVNGPIAANAAAHIPVTLGTTTTGVDNAGPLTVNYGGNLAGPGATPAQINNPTLVTGPATIDNSAFQSLATIAATGATNMVCVAAVELGGDTVTSTVAVSLGDGTGDSILLDSIGTPANNNVFGSTTLTEGNGAGDTVSVIGVTGARQKLKDLTITQGQGAGDKINVQLLTITNGLGIGVKTTQGDGLADSTVINNVLLSANAVPTNLPIPVTSLAGISVTQGNGNTDTATVTNATMGGNITVIQGSGGPTTTSGTVGDTITASGDTLSQNPYVNGSISLTQDLSGPSSSTLGFFDRATVTGFTALGNGGASAAGSNITITQGLGNNNTATVTSSTIAGNVSVTQTNGNTDTATVANVTPAAPSASARVTATTIRPRSIPPRPLAAPASPRVTATAIRPRSAPSRPVALAASPSARATATAIRPW